MKVPTRRWGNEGDREEQNELDAASMKVPTRRWGNLEIAGAGVVSSQPQ